jgi:hypothetical protein
LRPKDRRGLYDDLDQATCERRIVQRVDDHDHEQDRESSGCGLDERAWHDVDAAPGTGVAGTRATEHDVDNRAHDDDVHD